MLPSPIQWLAPAVLARLVLLLNHVVASEPQAVARLKPHAGRVIDIRWATGTAGVLPAFFARVFQGDTALPPIRLLVTPAGLFEAVAENAPVSAPASALPPASLLGLTLTVQLGDPIDLLKRALRGERPEVSIEGDAKLAEVASWMMKNLRWDIQDDVARFMGNTPAEVLRKVGEGISEALQRWRPGSGAAR
jgi:ubiquinone biosynthesis protein UbiJ